MSQNEVDKLIDNARLSSSISTDKVARTGLALLEQLFPSEDIDNSDYDAIIEAIINDAKKTVSWPGGTAHFSVCITASMDTWYVYFEYE